MGLVPLIGVPLVSRALHNQLMGGLERTFPVMRKAFNSIEQDQPVISPQEQQRLSNQELLDKLRQQIYIDQARLGNTNYPAYKGDTLAPMSAMTQNARKLRQEQYSKRAPYSKKIESLLKKESQGLSQDQVQNLLELLRRGQSSEQLVLNRLNKEFGQNFGYEGERANKLQGKINKDITQDLQMSKHNIGNLNKELKLLEDRNAQQNVLALQQAGFLKEGKKEALANQLEEFGNQQHAFDNLSNRAKEDVFQEEAMAPYRKINLANNALQKIDTEDMHPDRMKVQNDLLQKIKANYERPHANYPGQRVVGIEPETMTSFQLANQISPKYQDVFHGDKKNIERQMLEGDNLGTQVFNRIPENLNPLMSNLDRLAKKQLKKETDRIGGRYINSGTYGSGAHKAEVERTLREVMRKVQAEREGTLLGNLKDEGKLGEKRHQNTLGEYALMNQAGNKEFMDILRSNAALNKRGNEKWSNNQQQEDEAIKNWYSEQAHEWAPFNQYYQNLGRTQGNAKGRMDTLAPWENLAKGYNVDLKTLFSTPQHFNENKKALNEFDTDWKKKIRNQEDYYNQLQAEQLKQNQLAEERNRLAQLERERQEALRRQPAISVPSGTPQVLPSTNKIFDNYKSSAWDNYNNMVQLYKQYFLPNGGYSSQTGLYTPQGLNNQDQANKILQQLATGPGLPTKAAPSNINLSRNDFENPALWNPWRNIRI